jgi:predicted nucleotidyltransferase
MPVLNLLEEAHMVDKKIIEEVKKRLIKAYNPLEIYVFGSYAWGCPDEESDLDLLIVIERYEKDRHATLVEGHKALVDVDVSKDILVYSKDEFERFSNDVTRLCYKIKHKGRKIYAKA